jgi:hypothetical protein
MDDKFKKLIDDLHTLYEELINMTPVRINTIPQNTPKGGVYLFSEKGKALYTGRTKRIIKDRLNDHVSTADDCPFAWRLAREKTGYTTATYKKKWSRKDLLSKPEFIAAYEDAKERIRQMEIRYVGQPDPLKQALLEIYVDVVSNSVHNDFDTH